MGREGGSEGWVGGCDNAIAFEHDATVAPLAHARLLMASSCLLLLHTTLNAFRGVWKPTDATKHATKPGRGGG